jgi:hypothetical protein
MRGIHGRDLISGEFEIASSILNTHAWFTVSPPVGLHIFHPFLLINLFLISSGAHADGILAAHYVT